MVWKKTTKILKYKSLHAESPKTLSTLSPLVPKWFKDIPLWKNDEIKIYPENNKTLKHCVPFLDSLLTGYAMTLSADMLVSPNSLSYMSWGSSYSLAGIRTNPSSTTLPVPLGCSPVELTWISPVSVKIPKGYSALVTHPLNRYDLPFVTLTGVLDGEFVFYGGGNIPFFMKEGFEGVIPKGTPIAQIILFKREPWKLKEDDAILIEGELTTKKSAASVFTGWYKTEIWKKKYYQ
jgi:hypothetical protein